MVREWEAEGSLLQGRTRTTQRMSLVQGWEHFLADLEARNLHASTVRKYRLLSRQMSEYATQNRLRFLDQFDLPALSDFRAHWQEGALTRARSSKGCALSFCLLTKAIG